MRSALIVIGVLIAAISIAALLGKLDFTRDKEVLKVGEISASVKQEEAVPQWLGGLGVLVGAGLVAAGAMRRS